MQKKLPPIKAEFEKVFVSGTDTDVGKTLVSCVLASGLRADYWKPVQAGLEPCTDSDVLREWLGAERVLPEHCVLKRPMSPNQAAAAEGRSIDPNEFRLPAAERLVVEGAGGLMVPIRGDFFIIDLIQALGLPVVLAARSGLGTLNHTLLSLEALDRRNIRCLGIVLTGAEHPQNHEDLERLGGVPILGRIPLDQRWKPEHATELFARLSLG